MFDVAVGIVVGANIVVLSASHYDEAKGWRDMQEVVSPGVCLSVEIASFIARGFCTLRHSRCCGDAWLVTGGLSVPYGN